MAIPSEQLIIGALLNGFTKIDKLDYSLLKSDFESKTGVEILPIDITSLSEFIKVDKNRITMKNENIITNILHKEGSIIEEYFSHFSLENFLLLKINKLVFLDTSDLESILTNNEIKIIDKLNREGYLIDIYKGPCDLLESKYYTLSKKGQVRLYKYEHQKEYNDFLKALKILRCNTKILDEYLMSFNLDFPVWGVFCIRHLFDYAKEYGRNLLEPGAIDLDFKEPSQEEIKELLSIGINEHLYICHPNIAIKDPNPISKDIDYIIHINWDELDSNKMLTSNEYVKIIENNPENTLRTIKSILSEESKNDNSIHKYCLIIEEKIDNFKSKFRIKGIVENDYLGFKVVINKQDKKVLNKIKK